MKSETNQEILRLMKEIEEIEEGTKLEKLFNDEGLIDYTHFILDENLELENYHYTKAIDRTIDELFLMYTESIKTRYILISICTFTLLKKYQINGFNDFQSEHLEKDIIIKEKNTKKNKPSYKANTIAKFVRKVSEFVILNLPRESSNDKESEEIKIPTHILEYIIKLIDELYPLMPVKMSDGFSNLNAQILKSIKKDFGPETIVSDDPNLE